MGLAFRFVGGAGLLVAMSCTDAATSIANRCGQANPRIDGSPPGLVVRVAVDAATDSPSAAGFCVRAERADGTAFEALTDASGTATVPIDPAAGPWDVTAARYGFQAVSILGVDGPIAGPLYTEPPGLGFGGNVYDYWRVPPSSSVYQLNVAPPAGQEQLEDLIVFDDNVPLTLYSASNGYVFTEFFDMHVGAPSFQITAFSPTLGIFTLDPIARAAQPISVTLSGPPSPAPAGVNTDVSIELPWPVTVHDLSAGFPVMRSCGRGSQRCRVNGGGKLSFLETPTTTMPWHIDSYAAPMNADVAIASFIPDNTTITLAFTVYTLGTTTTISVPELESTSINGTSFATITFETKADAYDSMAAYLETSAGTDAVTGQTLRTVAWRVFTYRGASVAARALPKLPAGMKPSDIGGDFIGGTVSVLSGIDPSRSPWSSATLDGVATVAASR